MVKNLLAMPERPQFDPWVREIPWRRERQPAPVFLPGESHGQRSLVGYSLWGRKELYKTECLSLTHTHTHTRTHAHTQSCPIYPIFWLPLRSDRVVLSFQVERDLTPSDSHVSLPDRSGDLEGVFIKGHMDRARVDKGNSFTPRTDPGDLRPLEDMVACLHAGTVAECPCSCRGRQIKLDTDRPFARSKACPHHVMELCETEVILQFLAVQPLSRV